MSNEVNTVSRSKREYESTLGPKLLLIAEKPLPHDNVEIFDSPAATQYLSTCFKSKFKSVETHVTYVKDESNIHFTRNIFLNILKSYHDKGTMDFQNLTIAFVGQNAFTAFLEDYGQTIDTDSTAVMVNPTTNTIRVFSQKITASKEFIIPYKILPAVDESLSTLVEDLNALPIFIEEDDSPYCYPEQILAKLKFILELYKEGSLKYFRFDAKINPTTNLIEYFKIFDKYTNKELLFCPRDEKRGFLDNVSTRKEFFELLTTVLTTVPVHGETVLDAIKAFKFKDQIKVLNTDEIDAKPIKRNFCMLYGDKRGKSSEWYSKWRHDVYIPHVASQMKGEEKKWLDETHNMYEYVYDIEVFQEDWLFVAKSLDGKSKIVCWNDAQALRGWLSNKILIGFNNAAYDNVVIKHALQYPIEEFSEEIEMGMLPTVKQFSDLLITTENRMPFFEIRSKHNPRFLSWDINFHRDFDIRRNSLKKLTMSVLNKKNYDSSVPFDIDRALTQLEREEVERYCEMDVDNTLELFLPDENNKKRPFAKEAYDIKWNLITEYKMQAKTLITKSSSFAGKLLCGENAKADKKNTFKVVDGVKQYYAIPELALKELAGTELLDFYLKNQTNPDYISEKYEHYLGGDDEGHKYQFGFGGLHQALVRYGSTNLVNMDVASLYPSLLVHYGLMSRGAAARPGSYEEVYKTRLQAKKDGLYLLNEGLKLILNGAIGAMLSAFNPLYDTWANSSVCVHGQLLLYILVKRLYDAGFNIVQTNTDGIMIERQGDVDFMEICTKWEEETKLILEYDEIDILQQNNVNNYYCQFKGGYVKSKGFYLSNEKFGKATSKILCNLVVGASPLEGCAARDFVIFKRHSIGEIYDAVTRTKLEGRSLAFVLGKEDDPRTQGYYSRSRNQREVQLKDDKGKYILDENGNKVTEIVNTESTITGFNDYMLLVDDINELTLDEINTDGYVAFAKNLLSKEEVFGPYYNENMLKVEEPNMMQSLNAFKDHGDLYPTKTGVVCQNFLFEADYLTKEEQIEVIENCKDMLYRVVWSGNKSFHCVVRLDKPVNSMSYKKIWYYLKHKLKFYGADEQCSLPSKYTRVPGQINAKTGNVQELYLEDNNVVSLSEILDAMPRIKEDLMPKKFTGKRTLASLKRHVNRQEWGEGGRFAAVQKLSPMLVSLVTMEELLEMIPVKLDKDHLAVIRAKYHYFEKYGEAELENAEPEGLKDLD